MSIIKKMYLVALMVSLHTVALAGSPGGMELIVVATKRAASYTGKIKPYFTNYKQDSAEATCDDEQLDIAGIYLKSGSMGITGELAVSAVTIPKQRKKLNKMMTAFRDKNHDRGFDVALAYDLASDKLVFYGISAYPRVKAHSTFLALADIEDKEKLARAICLAIVQLRVLQ
jgi:hypothetical protein